MNTTVDKKMSTIEELVRQNSDRVLKLEENQKRIVDVISEFKDAHKEINQTLKQLEINNTRVDGYFDQFKEFMKEQQRQDKRIDQLETRLAVNDEKHKSLIRWVAGIGTGIGLMITAINLFVIK